MKLDRQNYIHWRAQILATIRALELESFIIEDLSPPLKFLATSTAGEDGSTQITENPDYKLRKRIDQLLLCWLLTTIGD